MKTRIASVLFKMYQCHVLSVPLGVCVTCISLVLLFVLYTLKPLALDYL